MYPKLYHVYDTCFLLSLTLARRITSFLHFFDYLLLLWRPSYTEHLLRQRPSSPTTTISCPLRLVPFEAVADKVMGAFISSLCIPSFACVIFLHSCYDYALLSSQALGCCWLSSSWSTLYCLRKISWFHKVRYIVCFVRESTIFVYLLM